MPRKGPRPRSVPLDVDGILAQAETTRQSANRPVDPWKVTRINLGWGWGYVPEPATPPAPPSRRASEVVMPGHVPNTMSARERKARSAKAKASQGQQRRSRAETTKPER